MKNSEAVRSWGSESRFPATNPWPRSGSGTKREYLLPVSETGQFYTIQETNKQSRSDQVRQLPGSIPRNAARLLTSPDSSLGQNRLCTRNPSPHRGSIFLGQNRRVARNLPVV